MFTWTARSLLRTLESINTPCSVNAEPARQARRIADSESGNELSLNVYVACVFLIMDVTDGGSLHFARDDGHMVEKYAERIASLRLPTAGRLAILGIRGCCYGRPSVS
jgi:hypothetical protein